MYVRLNQEERLFEEYVRARIKKIKKIDGEEYPAFKVYVDLSDIKSYDEILDLTENKITRVEFTGGWRNPTKKEVEEAHETNNSGFFEMLANNMGKIPVDTLEVDVRYIPLKQKGEYNGYYGWTGEVETVAFINRNMNCLARKMDVSPNLLEELEPYNNARTCCEGKMRFFNVSKQYYDELIGALEQMPGKIYFDEDDPYRNNNNKISVRFLEYKCPHYDKCDEKLKLKKWPIVHIPAPGQRYTEAKTGLARAIACAAAGIIAKSIDPAYPDRYGVYTARGYKPPYPIQQELFPSCCSCALYKYVKRGNEDEEADLRQPGLPEMKDSYPQIDWCRFYKKWIEEISVARFTSGYNKNNINKASQSSACEAYMWRTKYIDSATEDKYNPANTGWVASSKAIKVLEDNIIIAFAAANDIPQENAPAIPQVVEVFLQISNKLAEKHKKFNTKIIKE